MPRFCKISFYILIILCTWLLPILFLLDILLPLYISGDDYVFSFLLFLFGITAIIIAW